MARFDRYVFSQLLVLFGFFSLILVLIYWINRAVILFDQLIADGQSASVFLEFTLLSLPGVIRIALPLSAFAASVYVTNRMTSDSELIVVQATGYSPFRLARPVLWFGVFVALLMSVLMHFLVPLSSAQMSARQADISENISARLLTEGQFVEPVDGVTVYIRDITPDGVLHDLLLSDLRDQNTHVTYTASEAFLIRTAGEIQLVMRGGLVQTLDVADQRMFTTTFDDFAYNVSALLGDTERRGRRVSHLWTWELLSPTPELIAETRSSAARLISSGHDRVSQSLLAMVAALLGFAALIVGRYSRFGVWSQIGLAILLIVLVKGVEASGLRLSRNDPDLWFAAYLQTAVGFGIVLLLLLLARAPMGLFQRRDRPGLS